MHGDTLKELGIRVDNLSRSFKEVSVATLLGVACTVFIFMFYRESYAPRDPGQVFTGFLLYIVWGIAQQFGLNSFLYLRIKKVVENDSAAMIGAVVVFSLIHAPNTVLMAFTAVGGLIFCYLFSRNRNVFSLGVMHGILGMAALVLLMPGLMKNPTVGPTGSERYDAYGNSPLICSGDINGDGTDEILVSKGPAKENDSEVLVFSGNGVLLDRFTALDARSGYGANLAAGDVDGDGVDEIIAVRGPWHKNDSLITVLSGSGRELTRFYAFPGKKYGANIAAGDINGDGKDEIITGLGPGQGYRPVIKVFTGEGKLLLEFQANDFIENGEYHKEMRHGVRVSAGDIDGDGIDEIVAGPPHLKPYRNYFMTIDFDGGITAPKLSGWFCVYLKGYPHYGINLAAGDVDGDGTAEIVAGPGPDHKAVADLMVLDRNGALLFETFPFDTHYGLTVATADTDGDGVSEILATPGIGEEKEAGAVKMLDMNGVIRELDLRHYLK
ncbi:MAG: FG-GAP repeat protein [Deltaproteobacteria bacterium]|nr:FG-GAP repeat protein [Candidatus Zymogenaceae bacterium]